MPLPRPELAVLLVLAGLLYLWGLSKNGWANDYYSAAVRSMAGSWHDFLYGSFDAKGLMTVDKPPLALWVEALSVKLFGFGSLAILVPQALMGVASVGLLYDLTRRQWGRVAGTLAGLALALTPVIVAVSRHNNPDALLVLCSVGALWCFVRALEGGATKWLVAAGVCVGLGFEAKMGAALMVLPGMALAWLWVAPRGRLVAVRQLAIAGAALLAVALAWPVLVWLTPAASRPWISGTSDNSIWSLIWEYNGFGRLEGQTGGPASFGGAGGGPFGGATGPFRLLNESLGGQAGWLLGVAAVGGLGIAALSRLRRTDPRTGWIVAVGGSFAVTAVAFSFAGGIFHPYYTSLLAPFAAALVGATFAQARSAGRARPGPRRGRDRRRDDRRARRDRQQRHGPRLARRPAGAGRDLRRGRAPLRRPDRRAAARRRSGGRGDSPGDGSPRPAGRSGLRLRHPPRRPRDLVGGDPRAPDQRHLPRRRPRIGRHGHGRPRRCHERRPRHLDGQSRRRTDGRPPVDGRRPRRRHQHRWLPDDERRHRRSPGSRRRPRRRHRDRRSSAGRRNARRHRIWRRRAPVDGRRLRRSRRLLGGQRIPWCRVHGRRRRWDVRRRRPLLGPRIHRSPRRRDDRGRQPVRRLRLDHRRRGRSGRDRRLLRQRVLGQRRVARRADRIRRDLLDLHQRPRWRHGGRLRPAAPKRAACPAANPAAAPRAATRVPARNRRSTPWSSPAPKVESSELGEGSGTLYECG